MMNGFDETPGWQYFSHKESEGRASTPVRLFSPVIYRQDERNYAGEGHEMMCRFRERRPAMPFAKRRLLRRNVNFADRFRPIA